MNKTFGCVLMLLGGCSDQVLVSLPFGYGDGEYDPKIEVVPQSLDFGNLGAYEALTKRFVVRNIANSPYGHLSVHEVTLTVPRGFTFVTNDTDDADVITETVSFDLGQGMEEELHVRFAPDAPIVYHARADVRSNDPEHGVVSVSLTGKGIIPKLSISPQSYSFGEVTVGCEKEQRFILTNVGNAPLTVESLREDASGMRMEGITVPFTLQPGKEKYVDVHFTPSEGMGYGGDLVALSNDPDRETRSSIAGSGYVPQRHRQEWTLDVDPMVDVLFVVDRSPSMEDDQRALSDNFEGFIWEVRDYTPNWRIGVAMPDDGCLEEGIIDEDVENYDDVFTDAVLEDGDDAAHYSEGGLVVATNAVLASRAGECNEGFLRDGARLHVILVADEPEQSPFGTDYYVAQLVEQKGSASLVKISAVAGDYPWGCETSENTAEAGTGYYEAAHATYGRYLSLCDNWYENANELAQATVRMDTFPLERVPDPASITVEVNGDPANPAHWYYDAYFNAVVFTEHHEPHEGWTVVIEYADPSHCD